MIEAIVANYQEAHMHVREGMSEIVVTVGPGHTIRAAAAAMCRRNVGAAVVLDPDSAGPGVITERDILRSIAAGEDPDEQLVAAHLTSKLTFAMPEWSLEQAASVMVRGGFRHLVVVDGAEPVGILSMRDIVRVWTGDGATCEVPTLAGASS
jgi:CBS domain-containing protein